MIQSLLDHKLDSMDWNVVFHDTNGVWKFLGTRLTRRDDTITLPSVGFFPCLQVWILYLPLQSYFFVNQFKIRCVNIIA